MNTWMNHFQWWIIDFQGAATLLLAGTLIGVRLLRQPVQRVALAWVTSLGLAFLCIVAAVPAWPRFHALERTSAGRPADFPTPKVSEASSRTKGRFASETPDTAKSPASASLPEVSRQTETSHPKAPSFPLETAVSALSRLFVLGSAAMGLGLVPGLIEAAWLCRTARLAPAERNERLRTVAGPANPLPRLLLSSRVHNAVALGILRPTIMLPAALGAQVDENSLRAVLAHECAHIRNRDLWLLGLLRGLLVVLFPNPLYWAMRRVVRTNQEAVADASAAQIRGDDYANGLIGWMRHVTRPESVLAAPAVGIWEKPSELSRRIAMLIDEKFVVQTCVATPWRRAAAVLVGGAVIGLSLLTVRPVSGRDAGEAANSSGTVPPVVSPATDAQEKVLKQAGTLADSGKLAEAEERLNRLLAQTGGQAGPILNLQARKLRGDVQARMGRFQEAIRDMEQVVQTDPGDLEGWRRLTLVLAQIGDLVKYRARCKEMLHRFSDTTDPVTVTQLAQSCLVMPSALDAEDVVLAERLADAAVALTPPGQFFPWRSMTIGLAEYRRGKFARAGEIIDRLVPVVGEGGPGWLTCQVDFFFISAMTHQQLQETDKARAAFDHGRELLRSKLPALDSRDLRADWWAVVYANMLMAEAGKSIDGVKPSQH